MTVGFKILKILGLHSSNGDHCKSAQGGGISAKMTYENVYALGRWLHQNVLGVSHVSSFNNQALHIVYIDD